MQNSERDLVLAFKTAREAKKCADELAAKATEELGKIESLLIEYLDSKSATSTAKYDGLGYVQIQKPRLYASCKNEDIENLTKFLRIVGRKDLVKTTVLPSSLSKFVSECIESGSKFPEFINYYFKQNVKFYE